MKKLKVVVVLALAVVFFAGCKKETQKEFTAELKKQNEMNAGEYSIVIDKLSITDEDADAQTRASLEMAAKMVNGTKISGDYVKDSKKKAIAMNMNFDLLGQKIPLKCFVDQKKNSIYTSTDFLAEIIAIAKEFNATVPFNTESLEQVKDKYILTTEKDLEKQAGGKASWDSINESSQSDLFSDYLDTLEPDSFEKKEDTIKRTFTKKDVQGFIKYVKENGNKDDKKSIEELEKGLGDLTKYEQTTTLNTGKNTQKTTMKITVKNDDETTASIDLTMNNQAKDSTEKVELPKEADTMSMEEFEKILSKTQGEKSLVSDEDFNDLLEAIRSGQANLTQTQIEQLKRTYKPYLTEEQYKQLEEAFDQASQLSA